jgi:hypothetical protein
MTVTAYTPNVLTSDNSNWLSYVFVPSVSGQLGIEYNCVYESQSMPCVKAVLVQATAAPGATSYNIYRNGLVVASIVPPAGYPNPVYWDFNVTVGSTYIYQVIAVINGYEGLASNWPAHATIN